MKIMLINKTVNNCYLVGILCMLFFCFSGCEDDKLDNITDNRLFTGAMKNSTIRIVNLAEMKQLIVNGDSLTNFILREQESPDELYYPGTTHFPENGRLGKIWTITQDCFDILGKAKIEIQQYQWLYNNDPVYFSTSEGKNKLTDYYVLNGNHFALGLDSVIAIPRSIESPSRQDHFKIRILNLSADPKDNIAGMENLVDPLSLRWADGTPIDARLNNIGQGSYSQYVELPYGTYQFKVLTTDDRQVPGVGYDLLYLDPATSTLTSRISQTQQSIHYTYAPINSYKPGGVYTIVVSAQWFIYPYPGSTTDESLDGIQNGFEIIEDIDIPVNNRYANIQLVNALPKDGNLRLKVNGDILNSDGVGYGKASSYASVFRGDSKLELVNNQGTVLASKDMEVTADQNYTVWAYPSTSGQVQLCIEHNDLSGVTYIGSDDGQDDSWSRKYSTIYQKVRFLNLSPDYSYITYTTDNGQPFSSGKTQQLKPGENPGESPYVNIGLRTTSFKIMAYRSTATTTPGVWAEEIPVLKGEDFISRHELYFRGTPASDTGVYTVALIGQKGTDPNYKAKMIIIKHTK